ncbi:MAG TPA: hypothetical protein VGH34_15500 [Vicinamibacterales bacterium]|jgi:hypothetical protein
MAIRAIAVCKTAQQLEPENHFPFPTGWIVLMRGVQNETAVVAAGRYPEISRKFPYVV